MFKSRGNLFWGGILLVLLLVAIPAGRAAQPALFAYVGAGIKEPVSELAGRFTKKTGIKVEMTFNNSGALLGQLQLSRRGDLYIPGGMSFVRKARAAGLIAAVAGPMAYHVPIIITPKHNPAKIASIKDLARPGLKLILPDKKGTALGQTAFKIFAKLGIVPKVERNILAFVETPAKVIAAIQMGQGDAGIVEYSNAKTHGQLGFVAIDPAVNVVEELPCASLSCSAHQKVARRFLKFAAAEGPVVFAKHGFQTKI
ncbi:MAG: substrate-binding domain-containing protein [Bacillota bacterium]|jgi:molybdate transport system substrate-binding protein